MRLPGKLKNQHILYLFVGGTAFVADNGLFALLIRGFEVPLSLATAVAMTLGFLISFYGNKLLVFGSKDEDHEHSHGRQLAYYVLLLAINTIFAYLFIRLVSQLFDYPVVLKVISAIIIVLWNFAVYQKHIFRKKTD